VIVDGSERQALVGHDLIEVVHQVGLGHPRQLAQTVVIESSDVDAGQPLAVPRRAVYGLAHEVSQPLRAMEGQAIRRPVDPLDEPRRKRQRVRLMSLPECLAVTHVSAPCYLAAPGSCEDRRAVSRVRLR